MSDPNANVPVGTVADHEGQPRTILRDFDGVVIPAMTGQPATAATEADRG